MLKFWLLTVAVALGLGVAPAAQAQISDGVVKLGVLTDMSSLYADLSGQGSVIAARLAVEDFGAAKKGMKVDGKRPTILMGYGGFNVSETPEFRAAILPWLDAGGVWCDANLRGGGEFGRAWHEAGRLERKQNVFDDYYACAEFLVKDGVTTADRLVAHGGSNGGLLVGAAITQRPELWGAAVCEVPLLDMLRYQNFSIARYWVPEYGTAENAEQFKFLFEYSPYQHVKAGTRYPAVFLTAGENLALAPTLSVAHTGLMNSPGHRENILRPQFGRVDLGRGGELVRR